LQPEFAIRVSAALLSACFATAGFGQAAGGAQGSSSQSQSDQAPLPRLGIAVSVGTLGAGIEAATAITRRLNVRGGFNYFSYSLSGTSSDNLGYNGSLRLESAEALLDYYPFRGFHLSGGALIYDGFLGNGNVSVPGGQSFTLNGTTYYSSPSDPVTGTGKIQPQKAAPVALFGFGNLVPRSHRHFTVNADFGVAFQGSLNTTLNLNGSTCATATTGCATISSQPTVQSNIAAEQSKINKDLKPYNFYPVLRLSFGYKF
jgi:hypothetical protein